MWHDSWCRTDWPEYFRKLMCWDFPHTAIYGVYKARSERENVQRGAVLYKMSEVKGAEPECFELIGSLSKEPFITTKVCREASLNH